jgi:hypothetical protein
MLSSSTPDLAATKDTTLTMVVCQSCINRIINRAADQISQIIKRHTITINCDMIPAIIHRLIYCYI